MIIYNWLITIFWLIMIVYWLISALSAKKRVKGSPNSRSAGFRIIMVIVIILILQLPIFNQIAISYNNFFNNFALNILGIILCAAGISFAIWARIYLGRNWGMPMSIQEKSELVTSGPYTFVRHPIYTGIILAIFGSMLVEGFFWLVFLIFLSAYFVYSSKIEDGLMTRQFPGTYPDYKKKTKAFIPFIF